MSTFPLNPGLLQPRIKIIGLGGAGSHIVSRLNAPIFAEIPRLIIDTDLKSLSQHTEVEAIPIGHVITRGLSTGGDSEIGHIAADHDRALLKTICEGHDLIFLIAGLGGGVGSGALPIITQVASELGILTFTCLTTPFSIEGKKRHQQAEMALQKLQNVCDGVITLPNDLLFQQLPPEVTVLQAFQQADIWITQAMHAMCSLILKPGLITLDFATLKSVLSSASGKLVWASGTGKGLNAYQEALKQLSICPFGGFSETTKVDCLLIQILIGPDLPMEQFSILLNTLTEKFKGYQQTFIGASVDINRQETVELCVLGVPKSNISKAHHSKRPLRKDLSDASSHKLTSDTIPAFGGSARLKQDEFRFISEEASRGYFHQTEHTEWEGVDLDVPTFIRKGIKIIAEKK
jgi:cell division protein FtsZ